MRIAAVALVSVLSLGVALAAAGSRAAGLAQAPAVVPDRSRSALGSYPAEIRYLSNAAPFVVFDVAPRSLGGPGGDADAVTLSFIATETLRHVDVFAFVRPEGPEATQMAAGVPCGPRDAGFWQCTISARALVSRLESGAGQFGLRVEAEGLATDHSTVIVTMPVKGRAAARPERPADGAVPPAAAPRALTLLAAPAQ